MAAKNRRELPLDLARGQARFQSWREQRKPGHRIPRALWALAVRMAQLHGVNRTALAFGLDRKYLQRRIAAAAGPVAQLKPGPAFVELPGANLAAKECRIELDNGAGVTMRVQVFGYDAADLEALSRSFWNAR
jgi:hypothetical protein